MQDEKLIKKALRGDTGAFDKLVQPLAPKLYSLCLSIMIRESDAQDALQEALVKLWRNMSRFRGDSSFSTFAYSVTRNVCLDIYRKNARLAQESINELDENGVSFTDDRTESPEDALLSSERRNAVEDALSSLAEDMRQTVVLRDVQGYDYSQIAEMTAQPLGTVKSRINRARAKMVEFLKNNDKYAELFGSDFRQSSESEKPAKVKRGERA
ncbi:MAG: sigma-70 family RNA polymerase sigma factor [Eubacteriales bacterium]|nr:sigma-70 family RNA polymerase sigma factor [Eubacteriales bacterium]MDD3881515.1 sigma-70 family RNA polymerase sigma factor [Eubacteriales bacterium]MDD4513003.1 sigma-70 family RNA polymerase sigma factor [Eubacteriales bacterium]